MSPAALKLTCLLIFSGVSVCHSGTWSNDFHSGAYHNYMMQDTISDADKEKVNNLVDKFDEIKDHQPRSVDSNIINKPNYLLRISPESLPEWFFNWPVSDTANIYALGISDPGMEEDEAIKLATFRAWVLSFILDGVLVENVTDFFTVYQQTGSGSHYETKFEEYSKLYDKKQTFRSPFMVLDTHITRYGEALVWVKSGFNSGAFKCDSSDYEASVFNVGREVSGGYENHGLVELNANIYYPDSTASFFYRYRNYEDRHGIKSAFNGAEVPTHYENFYYHMNNPARQPADNIIRLEYGLWNSYIQNIFKQIVSKGFKYSSYIKKMRDVYRKKSNEDLTRVVSRNKIFFRITGIQLNKNDGLMVNIQFRKGIPMK